VLLRPEVPLRPRLHLPARVRLPEEVSREPPVPRALIRGRGELVAYARKRVGRDAEDVVQEAAVRALEKSAQLAEPGAARAWLFTIVRRLIVETASHPGAPSLDAEPATSPELPATCGCVLEQVKALPPAQAALLTRVVVDGMSVGQLAAELGITTNNAWVRLHRARAALRRQLATHCGTESLRDCLDCGCDERGCCR
jgi:RNA polymerase sigma-70 factor (ECF subfamily)